jgi:5-(carboxyamino)imidazole ribonucleotide synthase
MKLGVLGGGQLARMLAMAAHPLGIETVFVDPNPRSPARAVAEPIAASWEEREALLALAGRVDVATYEFENVPDVSARVLGDAVPLLPPPEALRVSQDRLVEKESLAALGVPTPPFRAVDDREGLRAAVAALGVPCVLKTRRFGYDGKGQSVIRSDDDDALDRAWALVGAGRVPCILEGFVRFERELSQLVVRDAQGHVRFYPIVQSFHDRGILRETLAPAPDVPESVAALARDHAARLAAHLGYVGTLALELFDAGGTLLANEFAPRVHNSGHWTIEGAETSQFENHVRAVCGLPLGDTRALGRTVSFNLLGGVPDTAALLAVPGAHLHLYGKSPAPWRKLGHLTLVERAGESDFEARRAALRALVNAAADLPEP